MSKRKKSINETFTCDLRHNYTTVSLDYLEEEIEDRKIEPSAYYNEEELALVWKTLKELYDIHDEHYIIMYLMYYLGLSFRKTANIIERGPSFVFLYANSAIAEVQKKLKIQVASSINDDIEQSETEELP